MKSKDGPDATTLSRIREAPYRKPAQSPLTAWFQRNYAGFAAIMDRPQKPAWEVIAAELAADGIVMENGKPLTAAYARHTWWKVQKARGVPVAAKPCPPAPPIEQSPAALQPLAPIPHPAPASIPPRPGAMPPPAFDPHEGSDVPRVAPVFGVSKFRD